MTTRMMPLPTLMLSMMSEHDIVCNDDDDENGDDDGDDDNYDRDAVVLRSAANSCFPAHLVVLRPTNTFAAMLRAYAVAAVEPKRQVSVF